MQKLNISNILTTKQQNNLKIKYRFKFKCYHHFFAELCRQNNNNCLYYSLKKQLIFILIFKIFYIHLNGWFFLLDNYSIKKELHHDKKVI
ncbi:hypothetical protein PSOLA_00090 [Candidatus Phytoplasma solani]|nr:hypothetical protein S284_00430 [Candidatus Phytoplasma solani]